ncbi:MAG: HDOD domain-containing protein [Oceanospirillaceae bacterium]
MKNENKLTLRNINKRLKILPALPSSVCELMQLNSESDDFFAKIAEISQYEPSLTTRVLKVVNSIKASPVKPITDINQALVRAGCDEILSFITMMSVAQVFTPVSDNQKKLWQHSIEVALFSRYLASNNPSTDVDPNLAYTSGLLHDIGRLVLFNLSTSSVDFIASKHWSTPVELPEIESQYFGFTHAQVGYLAAKRWQLPQVITDVIMFHHVYAEKELLGLSGNFKQLLYIIQLSDYLSMYLMKDNAWQELDDAQLLTEITHNCVSKISKNLKIDSNHLILEIPAIVEKAKQSMRKLRIS